MSETENPIPPSEGEETLDPRVPGTASGEAPAAERGETRPDDSEDDAAEAKADRFIVLLRHGIAEERGGETPDQDRKLTKKGATRMKEIGRGLAEVLPGLDAIFTSPLLRAYQTGVNLGKGYGGEVLVREMEELAPGQGSPAFKALLGAIPYRRVIFVGHEPDLTRLLGDLCDLDTQTLSLKKGACYGIRVKPSGEMRLEWMLPPGVLRRIRN